MNVFDVAAGVIPKDHHAHEWLAELKQDAESGVTPLPLWTAKLQGFMHGLHDGGVVVDSCDLYDVLDKIEDLQQVYYSGNLIDDCNAAMFKGQSHAF